MNLLKWIFASIFLLASTVGYSSPLIIKMYKTAKTGHGEYIGTITAKNTKDGLLLQPNLQGLPPGEHGFHVHQDPSCENLGLAAGGHYDPEHTNMHLGPYRNGHLGDLPRLFVNKEGQATKSVVAPRLNLADLQHHALIIHIGGDNYSDYPKRLGGGGARIACGIIQKVRASKRNKH